MKIELLFRLHIDGCEPMDFDYESAKKLFKELKSIFEPPVMTKDAEELLRELDVFRHINKKIDIPTPNPNGTGPANPLAQPTTPPYTLPWPGYPAPYIGDLPPGLAPYVGDSIPPIIGSAGVPVSPNYTTCTHPSHGNGNATGTADIQDKLKSYNGNNNE